MMLSSRRKVFNFLYHAESVVHPNSYCLENDDRVQMSKVDLFKPSEQFPYITGTRYIFDYRINDVNFFRRNTF